MPPRVLDSYKRGIREMLNRPPTDPRNWYRNAFIHVFDCPHQNWWFLAWHRAYIGWLEAAIRAFSGDAEFALPYWDWTKTPRVPAAMFDDVLDPNNAVFIPTFDAFKAQFDAPVTALFAAFSHAQQDVLAQRGLASTADFWSAVAAAPAGMFFEQPGARGLTSASPDLDRTTKATVAAATIRSALRTANFAGSASGTDAAGFASAKAASHNDQSREGILESQPHDNVHGAMGGAAGNAFMVSFLSPVDPIFFLHHANLDRLWDVWTRRQAALGRPTLPQGADLTTWSNEQFLFFSDPSGQPAAKTNAGDYAAMSVFDYDYSPGSGEDQVPAPGTPVAAVPATRAFSAQITSATIGAGGGRCRAGARGRARGGPAAGAAARCRGHVESRARRPGPPLPRPGLAAGRRHSDRSGRDHHIQPPRPWSHHVHRAAAGKSRRARGRRRGERSPRHPRRPARTGARRGAHSTRARDSDVAPGRQDHRANELTTRMRPHLAITALAASLLAFASVRAADEAPVIELAAPRAAAGGESVELAVTTGALPRGARLALSTENGEILGAVTPYAPGLRSTTATVPVPRSAIVDGRLRLRVQVLEPGAPPRPPRPGEVQRLELVPRSE
jgi:hypothetical protein